MSMESIKQDIRIDIDNILDNLTTAPVHNNHTVIVNPKTNKLWINSILDLITQGHHQHQLIMLIIQQEQESWDF